MLVHVLVDEEGRLSGTRAFSKAETAEFAKNGARMFAPKGDTRQLSVACLEIVEGDIDDFLATAGLGPKGRKR